MDDLTSQTWALIDLNDNQSFFIQSTIAPLSPITQTITRKFNEMLSQRTASASRSIFNPTNGQLLQYYPSHRSIHIIDFRRNVSRQIELPICTHHVVPFSDHNGYSSIMFIKVNDEQKPILSMIQHNLDTIGLANSGDYWNEKSVRFSSAYDYLSKVISFGDVPPQEM